MAAVSLFMPQNQCPFTTPAEHARETPHSSDWMVNKWHDERITSSRKRTNDQSETSFSKKLTIQKTADTLPLSRTSTVRTFRKR